MNIELDARDQEDKGDVGVDQHAQDLLDRRHGHLLHGGVGRVQRYLFRTQRYRAPVELGQQVVQVVGDQVNHPQFQRLLLAGGLALADGPLGPIHRRLAAPGGKDPRVFHHSVGEFLYRGTVYLCAASGHRMGRADGRVGSHRRPRSRQCDQRPGGGGHSPARPDVDDDRRLRVFQRLHDLEHGGDVAAGGVEQDDDRLRSLPPGRFDGPVEIVGGRVRDRAVHRQHVDFLRALRACGRQRQQRRKCDPQYNSHPFHPIPPTCPVSRVTL